MSWLMDPKDYVATPIAFPQSGPVGATGPMGRFPIINKITGSDGRQYQVIVGGATIPDHRAGPAYIFKDEADLAKAYIEAIVSLQQIQSTMNGG